MSTIALKGIIFEGKTIPKSANIDNSLLHEHELGLMLTHNSPISCTRCKSKKMYICKDGDEFVCFCSFDECMKLDSEASKEISRKEYAEKKERNEFGTPITGAEKFRLGSQYKNASLTQWKAQTKEQEFVCNWLKNDKPFLVILGSVGTGKTYLSASVLNYFFDLRQEVYYTTHRRFIEELHKGIKEEISQHHIIEKFTKKRILILDDLGAATCTEWQQEMILELIDQRYSNRMKTLITSNLTKNQLKEKLSERTASRILDHKNEIIEFFGNIDQRSISQNDEEDVFKA